MSIVISLDADDFERLWVTSSGAPASIDEITDRFLDPATGTFPDVSKWAYAYWFDSYANLLLARGFLAAYGELFQVCSDEYIEDAPPGSHVHDPGWVIFTDYASPCWAKRYAPVSLVSSDESTPEEQKP